MSSTLAIIARLQRESERIDFSAMSATYPKQPRIRLWAAGPLENCLSGLRLSRRHGQAEQRL